MMIYKKIFLNGAWLTPSLIELMVTEDGRETLYQLLKLYVEGNGVTKPRGIKGGIIKDKYEIKIA